MEEIHKLLNLRATVTGKQKTQILFYNNRINPE
jgi:hypothetical protein